MATVVYGLPDTIDVDALTNGDVVLGGCLLRLGAPAWRCLRCSQGMLRAGDERLVFVTIE